MIKVITSLFYASPIFEHWLTHYSNLDVGQIFVDIFGSSPELRAFVQETAKHAGLKTVTILHTHPEPDPSLAAWNRWIGKNKEMLRLACANPDDWLIPADVDEFIQFPASLPDLIREMDTRQGSHISGIFADRISLNGDITPVCESPTIWKQYPLECKLTENLLHACSAKVTLCRGNCSLGIGHHRAAIGSPTRSDCTVHHFKWQGSVVESLKNRSSRYSSLQRPRIAKQSEDFLEYYNRYNRIVPDHFKAKRGWDPDDCYDIAGST